MFDLYIMYIFIGAKVNHTSSKKCRVGKLSMVRANNLQMAAVWSFKEAWSLSFGHI